MVSGCRETPGQAVSELPNGKILAAGTATTYSGKGNRGDSYYVFGLDRYRTNGTLDPAFGRHGHVRTRFGTSRDTTVCALVTAGQRGKIVEVGTSTDQADGPQAVALARYLPNGELDRSFSRDGKVLTTLPGEDSAAYAAVGQPDGKILVAGLTGGLTNSTTLVLRYDRNGRLDHSFGQHGVVRLDVGDLPIIQTMALTENGQILVAGEGDFVINESTGRITNDLFLARLNRDGGLDSSFGQHGIAKLRVEDVTAPFAITQQRGGQIVLAGMTGTISFQATDPAANSSAGLLVRYTARGQLDHSFGQQGKELLAGRRPVSFSAIGQEANGYLVVGGVQTISVRSSKALIARYSPQGQLAGSRAVSPLSGSAQVNGLLVQPDNKIVATGALSEQAFVARLFG